MTVRAIGLLSGGLDSTLATKLMLELGIEIIGFNTKTPFCLCDRASTGCSEAKRVCDEFGIEFTMMNVTDEFLEILKNPKHGYGSNMNPCIDCRILLFTKAKELMKEVDAQFIFTGEVVAQRPMSQHRKTLKLIEKEAGLIGLVLRPLSAKILEPTVPELEGWVDREKLLDFSGRSRKPQIELAKEFDIKDYPCAAGGCLLTDPNFAKRLKDLFDHEVYDLNSVQLLKVGRHFRFSPKTKIVVGRNERDNTTIANLARAGDILVEVQDYPSPLTLIRGEITQDAVNEAARYTKRYSDTPEDAIAEVKIRNVEANEATVISL